MINRKPNQNKENLSNTINNNYHECPFDDDWQLINQFIEEGIGPSEDKLAINGKAQNT